MGKKTLLTIQMLVASLFVMLLTVFLFTDNFTFSQAEVPEAGEGEEVFEGTADGYGGPINVEVRMKDGEIVAVIVLDHSETDGISDPAINNIPEAMVEANSADVDTVSGATFTSEGIIAAVNNALGNTDAEDTDATDEEDAEEEVAREIKAMVFEIEDGTYEGTADGHNGPVTVEVTVAANKITDVTLLEHEETEGASDPAIEGVPEAIVEHQSTQVDIVSGVTYSSNAIMAATENALGIGKLDTVYTDGTYEGTAEAHNGPLTVEVTVVEGEISNVEITDHEETDGLADPAIEEVSAAIIKKNRADVPYDAVSGATVTSDAIMEAVQAALDSAE